MTVNGPRIPDGWRRRVLGDLAASPRPETGGSGEADGSACWDEWYRRDCARTLGEIIAEPPGERLRRAFLAGWDARDAVERRKAAGELTALTEELGLYDDGPQS